MSDENTDTIVDPALTADPPPADPPQPEPSPEPQPRMIPADVLVREVTPLRAKLRDSDAALEEHRRQLREANELIARLQSGNKDTPPSPRELETGKQFTQEDVQRAAIELNFQEKARSVFQAGANAYGQKNFQDACNLMETFGLNNADFVASVMEIGGVEKTHEIFHSIAQDPEKVAALAGMSPVQRVREITRIADKMTAKPAAAAEPAAEPPKPARTVSRAPAPAPRVEPAASKVVDWRTDAASDAEFSKGFDEAFSKRHARR